MTVSQAKTWYSISFNLTSRVQIISDHKHISCFPMLLRSTKHISWPLWWWWWYELLSIRVRPYKSSKFKAQIGENILQKLWRVVKRSKVLGSPLHGSEQSQNKQLAQQGDKENCAGNFSSTWIGHKSLQYNQNYNQVFTLLMLQNKDLFNT